MHGDAEHREQQAQVDPIERSPQPSGSVSGAAIPHRQPEEGGAHLEEPEEGSWSQIVGDLGSVDLTRDPALAASRVVKARVFRGYSGWAPLQLEDELEEGAWMVLPAEAGDVFTPHPDALWRAVLRRQGGRLAWVADAPDDLSSN